MKPCNHSWNCLKTWKLSKARSFFNLKASVNIGRKSILKETKEIKNTAFPFSLIIRMKFATPTFIAWNNFHHKEKRFNLKKSKSKFKKSVTWQYRKPTVSLLNMKRRERKIFIFIATKENKIIFNDLYKKNGWKCFFWKTFKSPKFMIVEIVEIKVKRWY